MSTKHKDCVVSELTKVRCWRTINRVVNSQTHSNTVEESAMKAPGSSENGLCSLIFMILTSRNFELFHQLKDGFKNMVVPPNIGGTLVDRAHIVSCFVISMSYKRDLLHKSRTKFFSPFCGRLPLCYVLSSTPAQYTQLPLGRARLRSQE